MIIRLLTQCNGLINRLYQHATNNTRRPNIQIDQNLIAINSPIYFGIVNLNRYKNVFDITDSIPVIKNKLKNHFLYD